MGISITGQIDSAALRSILDESLDLEELRTLCADLGVDYDGLRGEGKAAKLRELIAYLERRREILKLLQIVFNLWLLFVLIFSFTLLLASFSREGSKTGARAAAITLVFYLLHFLSGIWDTLKFTRPVNIFTYYQPAKLMFELESARVNVAVLTVLTGICLAVSLWQFKRRDIPG